MGNKQYIYYGRPTLVPPSVGAAKAPSSSAAGAGPVMAGWAPGTAVPSTIGTSLPRPGGSGAVPVTCATI